MLNLTMFGIVVFLFTIYLTSICSHWILWLSTELLQGICLLIKSNINYCLPTIQIRPHQFPLISYLNFVYNM